MPFAPIDLTKVPDAKLRKAIADGVVLREREVTRLEAENAKAATDLTAARADLTAARAEVESAKARIADLLGKIEPGNVPRPKIKVDQLVNGLRTQIEGINAEIIKARVGGAMLVDGCEVEIKGGLDVSDGIQLVTLAESALGADTVSTLRFALRPAPVLRVDDGT